MHILLISPLPPPAGGIASWTKRYLSSPIKEQNQISVINTAILGARSQDFKKINLCTEFKRNFKILKELHYTLKRKNIDIVHLNSPCSKLGLFRDYFVCRMIPLDIPIVVHYRCDVTYMLNNDISIWLFKKISKAAAKVICLNQISKEYTIKKCGCDVDIVPNFISDELLKISYMKKQIVHKIKNVLFVGHVTYEKGFYIIKELALKFPELDFICVGSIEQTIFQTQIPNNLKLVGELQQEQLKEYYVSSDLFLFPTRTEGFPNVVAESMAYGLPIISTPVGAIPDMLDKNGGILVEIDNLDGFISAVKTLSIDTDKRISMSEWNKNKVQMYSLKTVTSILMSIYKQCIKEVGNKES